MTKPTDKSKDVQCTASMTYIWHFRGCVAPVMIISTAVSVMTVVITENKLKVVPKLLTWYQPMAVEKKKNEELTLLMLSELIYDTSKKNHVNHVNKEFTKSLFNCFRFATHCVHVAHFLLKHCITRCCQRFEYFARLLSPPLIAVHTSSYTSASPLAV